MTDNHSHSRTKLSGAGSQFLQSLNVLSWFRANPNGSFMKASTQLGLPVAQIKHELHKLSCCGLPGYLPGQLVEVSVDKTTAHVSYAAGLDRPLTLTTMEAGVLLFNLEALRSVLPEDSYTDVDSVSTKLRNILRQRRQHSDISGRASLLASQGEKGELSKDEVREAEYLTLLRQAIDERRLVSADYHSLSSDTVASREWTPDHLALINGETYLWGREADREQRTYAVTRMSGLKLNEPGSADTRLIPQISSEDPFNFAQREDWAILTLSPEVAWMLEYYPMWVVDDEEEQSTPPTPRADKQRATTVTLPDTGSWLERFCVAHAHDIDVVEPIGLKERVRQRAQQGLAAYSD